MLNHMTAGYIITYRSSMIHFNITPVLSFSVRSTVLLFSGFSNRTFYELYFSPTWALFPAQIIHNYLLTYSMAQSPTWESIGFQLVKKFSAFYGTRRFITSFTSARHLSLSWTNSIQSIPPTSHFLKIHFNIILQSTSGSPKLSLSLRFPHHLLLRS